jgi:uncharacterized repeat protein (TIGR01451 family)
MKMPDQFSSGDTLKFRTYFVEDSSGHQLEIQSFIYTPIVLCSFDPNDKLVVPAGIKDDRYVLFTDTLHYTVRFQNTGNAEAIDVTILDTLDQNMDMNTFEVISSSHPVYTSLDDHAVKFYYPNIWLPDSLSNEPESHGFVSYQVQAKDPIEEFSLVKNKADIIFDFNTPVITDPVHNTFVSSICDDIIHHVDTTICEGQSFLGYASSGHFQEFYPIGNVCDSILDLYLNVVERNDSELNRTYCLGETFYFAGEYFVADANRTFYDTTFSWEGCIIWTSTLHAIVNTPAVGYLDTVLCEGQTFQGYSSSGQYVLTNYNPQTECFDTIFLDLTILPDTAAGCITKTLDIDKSLISIFPNPAHHTIYITSDEPVHRVSLLRPDGMILKSQPLLSSSTEISFELDAGILPGLYIIEAILENGRVYGKVMVE